MPLGDGDSRDDHPRSKQTTVDADDKDNHSISSSSSSASELDFDPTVSLLRRDQSRTPSIPLKKMLGKTTRSSRGSGDGEVPATAGARSRPDSQLGARRDDASQGEAQEPAWMLAFDDRRSAKENKSLAVSAELDAMGMGRYQWCVFVLCGLGFFIDLLWAQGFGLITVPLELENGFGAEAANIGTLSTAFNVGLTVGAFSWGIGVDVVGRKWSFYLTCLIAGIFGIASGASPNYTALRVLIAFVGFGVGGNIPIDCTITLEFLPTRRHFLLALLSVFQPIGVLVASGIAYAFIPKYSCAGGNDSSAAAAAGCTRDRNPGWRYTLYVIGAITLFIFFIRFVISKFRESPAYLINRGHDEEALEVLYAIAKTNKVARPTLSMEDFKLIEKRCAQGSEEQTAGSATLIETEGDLGEDGLPRPTTSVTEPSDQQDAGAAGAVDGRAFVPRALPENMADDHSDETTLQTLKRTLKEMARQLRGARILFRDAKMARITVLLWLTYMADFFGFNIAGVFLPLILRDRGQAAGRPLSDTYRDYVVIYTPGLGACLIACALIEVPRVGRQWVMVISSALMGVSMFLYTTIDTQPASVGLNAMEYFFQSLFNAVLYAVVPEFYPSAVRGTASGLASTLGRISGIIAPIAGQSLYSQNGANAESAAKTLYLGGAITLICPLALILLPYDTRGRRSY